MGISSLRWQRAQRYFTAILQEVEKKNKSTFDSQFLKNKCNQPGIDFFFGLFNTYLMLHVKQQDFTIR